MKFSSDFETFNIFGNGRPCGSFRLIIKTPISNDLNQKLSIFFNILKPIVFNSFAPFRLILLKCGQFLSCFFVEQVYDIQYAYVVDGADGG